MTRSRRWQAGASTYILFFSILVNVSHCWYTYFAQKILLPTDYRLKNKYSVENGLIAAQPVLHFAILPLLTQDELFQNWQRVKIQVIIVTAAFFSKAILFIGIKRHISNSILAVAFHVLCKRLSQKICFAAKNMFCANVQFTMWKVSRM